MQILNNCIDCPLRLFNTKCHNLQGIGNPWNNRVIVVPNVDYDAYKNKDMSFSSQVDVIKSIISSTGELNDLYIVPLIRCNETIGCEINNDIIKRCYQYFIQDITTYQWKHILLCGISAERILGVSIGQCLNDIFVSRIKHAHIAVNYNPLIKYIDNSKYNTFVTHLQNWYSYTFDSFNGYNYIYL